MRVTVYPGRLSGTVRAIPSKSDAHRKLICAALADRETRMPLAASNDIDATIRCLRALGARIDEKDGYLAVSPIRLNRKASLDCGESGSTLRFMMPLAAALGVEATFLTSGSLADRPNGPLIDALAARGAHIEGGILRGKLHPGRFTLPGNVSSQFFSGLLMALPLLSGPSTLLCEGPLESEGYVDMTTRAMKVFGVTVFQGYWVEAPRRYMSPGEAQIEGDWSSAAFFFAANALGSGVSVTGLQSDSFQPDRGMQAALLSLGGEIDVSGMPDIAPALTVCAAFHPGETRITGAARLRIKESDRIGAMADCLAALGADIEAREDGLVIRGGAPLHGGEVSAHNDHRIAMAMAIAGTAADGPVVIHGAEAVKKSYPGFFDDFQMLGGRINVK